MIHSKIITTHNAAELEKTIEQYIQHKKIIKDNLIDIKYSHSRTVTRTFNGNVEEAYTSFSAMIIFIEYEEEEEIK